MLMKQSRHGAFALPKGKLLVARSCALFSFNGQLAASIVHTNIYLLFSKL